MKTFILIVFWDLLFCTYCYDLLRLSCSYDKLFISCEILTLYVLEGSILADQALYHHQQERDTMVQTILVTTRGNLFRYSIVEDEGKNIEKLK